MLGYIEYLNVPTKVAIALVGIFLFMQIIGEILEFMGKIVPEFMKIRKYFSRKKQERKETTETLKQVKALLNDVNTHYSADNIQKRDGWMQWVNDRATVYDNSIVTISEKLDNAVEALRKNTKMTEEIFVQNSRDRIIDFATKVANENKSKLTTNSEINAKIAEVTEKYSGRGRVLIRPSGTEPLVRVMIEGKDVDVITEKARMLADLLEKKLG